MIKNPTSRWVFRIRNFMLNKNLIHSKSVCLRHKHRFFLFF